jgi:hypothetical protein
MPILTSEPLAKKVRFDDEVMWVDLSDGRVIGVPLVYFPQLKAAKKKKRADFIISGGGRGLHWDDLDVDICVKNLLFGFGEQTKVVSETTLQA